MNFPTNVKYTKEHEWIRLEGDVAYVGITDYAQEQNEALEEQPELVNKDPYGEGWLIKIKPAADADFDSLLDAEAYKALINE